MTRRCRRAGYNLFQLHADDVLIDLLTDSGTGAMAREQWAGDAARRRVVRGLAVVVPLPRGGARSCRPFRHVIPTHQGRAAERILFSVIGGPGKVVPNNTHFDTTRANVEFTGAEALDLVIPEGALPVDPAPVQGQHRPRGARGAHRRARAGDASRS